VRSMSAKRARWIIIAAGMLVSLYVASFPPVCKISLQSRNNTAFVVAYHLYSPIWWLGTYTPFRTPLQWYANKWDVPLWLHESALPDDEVLTVEQIEHP